MYFQLVLYNTAENLPILKIRQIGDSSIANPKGSRITATFSYRTLVFHGYLPSFVEVFRPIFDENTNI
jgi:hypothetical protein